MKSSSWEVGRNLPHNNTVSNKMNKREPTFKKEELVWITFDDWLWSIVVLLMSDAEFRGSLLWSQANDPTFLPVIRY
jgi:hypothetical protein